MGVVFVLCAALGGCQSDRGLGDGPHDHLPAGDPTERADRQRQWVRPLGHAGRFRTLTIRMPETRNIASTTLCQRRTDWMKAQWPSTSRSEPPWSQPTLVAPSATSSTPSTALASSDRYA